MLESEMDEAGMNEKKPEKAKQARQRVMDRVLSPGETPKGRFVDPAAKFG